MPYGKRPLREAVRQVPRTGKQRDRSSLSGKEQANTAPLAANRTINAYPSRTYYNPCVKGGLFRDPLPP